MLEAADAEEAIGILDDRSDILAVVTDIDMLGSMDGLELAVTVRHRWPHISIVVTSGKLRPRADEMPEGGHFIPKPYDPGELIGLVRTLCITPSSARGRDL